MTSFLQAVEAERARLVARIDAIDDIISLYREFERPFPKPDAVTATVAASGAEAGRAHNPIPASASHEPDAPAIAESATEPAISASLSLDATPPVVDAIAEESSSPEASSAPHSEKAADAPPGGEVAPASPPPNLRPGSRAAQILTAHTEHPEWNASDIARSIDMLASDVARIAKAKGIVLPKGKGGRRPNVSSAAQKPAVAPPAPEPVEPLASPFAPVGGEEPRRIVRPSGQQMWLRDENGAYLNRYCSGMTTNRKEAWTGTAKQAASCRANYLAAKGLKAAPVEKTTAPTMSVFA